MKKLCCVLDPAWKCAFCDWKMCYSCWNRQADDCHRAMAPRCLLSAKENNDIGCKISDGVPYILTKRDM